MKGIKVLSGIYADSVVRSIRERGLTDENILQIIKEIANQSFVNGASAAMEIASEFMNEYYKSINEETE